MNKMYAINEPIYLKELDEPPKEITYLGKVYIQRPEKKYNFIQKIIK